MKILFFGDYSNLHACLARELRTRGHEVTVISDGGRYMDTEKDILLDRAPGKMGAVKYLLRLFSIIPSLKDYDVVQLINPHFIHLKPGKIKYFFDILKRNNRSVFLTLAGNDYHFVKACIDGETFRFSEFMVGDKPTEFETVTHHAKAWTQPGMKEFAEYIYANIDGAMSVLPEYDMAARPILGDKVTFTNIPVDIDSLDPRPLDLSGKINLFIGMREGMEIQKGTAQLLAIARRLEKEMPDRCSVTCVRNLPLKEYLSRMQESHIVLDQLYSYSPGTNAFQAMALGKVAGTGAQPEFYEYIGEPDQGAILPLSPLVSDKDWEDRLRQLILDPSRLQAMADEGRRIVNIHNHVATVADKFENHWKKIIK
ncbi:MAG: hypothetical protein K2K97_06845 [Muribaculaceae bacterium]|nr:hypothetical protein [Muribaculaceae bacterium]